MTEDWPFFLCFACILAVYALSRWLARGYCTQCRLTFDWFADAALVPDYSATEVGKRKWIRRGDLAQEHARWPAHYAFTCPSCKTLTTASSYGMETEWLPLEDQVLEQFRECPWCKSRGYNAVRDVYGHPHEALRTRCEPCDGRGFILEHEIETMKLFFRL